MSDVAYRPRIKAITGPLVQVYEDGQVVVAVEHAADIAVQRALGTLSQLARGLGLERIEPGNTIERTHDYEVNDRGIGRRLLSDWVLTPGASSSGETIVVGTPEIASAGLPPSVPHAVLSPAISSISSLSFSPSPPSIAVHASEAEERPNSSTAPVAQTTNDTKGKLEDDVPLILKPLAFLLAVILTLVVLRIGLAGLDYGVQRALVGVDYVLHHTLGATGWLLGWAFIAVMALMRVVVLSVILVLEMSGLIEPVLKGASFDQVMFGF